ncbi:response regulator [Lysinibacillus boronitolerans]|uniref:response regulator n=2 Tax=Lysinibacillus boronitolerans TaxID=309788 RepID=UPI0038550C6B
MNDIKFTHDIMQEHEVERYFKIWRESVIRSRLTITVVFLKTANSTQLNENVKDQVTSFLQSKIRKTDLLFQLSDGDHWGIFFLQSSDLEARAFLKRIFAILKAERKFQQIALKASITEIRSNNVIFEELINKNKQMLSGDEQLTWSIAEVKDYCEQPTELVKVSIIEQNAIFRQVLESTLNQINIPYFSLDVKVYEDGYSFLQSDDYKSGHMHLILMNDILPLKNGLEILHILRHMPNEKKFIIYMMSERNSEGAALNAYEGGVDEYIVKPFNLRLLEAKIKRKKLLHHDTPEINIRALKGLYEIGIIDEMDSFVPFVTSEMWEARLMVAKIFKHVPLTYTYSYLEQLLQDENWWVRSQAAKTIVEDRQGIAKLQQFIESSNDQYAIEMAQEIAARKEGK